MDALPSIATKPEIVQASKLNCNIINIFILPLCLKTDVTLRRSERKRPVTSVSPTFTKHNLISLFALIRIQGYGFNIKIWQKGIKI